MAFLSGAALAQAAESSSLAEHAGFLLGNAHRCGVAQERVMRAGQVISNLIVAAAGDDQEAEAARTRFAEVFLASAHPELAEGMLVPPCKTVTSQFERLERHHEQARLNN